MGERRKDEREKKRREEGKGRKRERVRGQKVEDPKNKNPKLETKEIQHFDNFTPNIL